MSTGFLLSSGLRAPTRFTESHNTGSLGLACRSKSHAQHGLLVSRPKPFGPGAARRAVSIKSSAVVERPQEADLQSVDLGWPRGFPSRYALGAELGRGSFGIVYLATDRVSGEEVAAKIIPKERNGTTREHILEKIQQEVCVRTLLWSVQHSSFSLRAV